jgi:hypothetical protein
MRGPKQKRPVQGVLGCDQVAASLIELMHISDIDSDVACASTTPFMARHAPDGPRYNHASTGTSLFQDVT